MNKTHLLLDRNQKKLFKLLPIMFYALLILFLFFYIKHINFSKIKNVQFAWQYVLVASVFGLTSRYWAIVVWFVLLRGLGATNLDKARGQLIYVYSKAWLGRYIPGTAPWILGRIYFASKHGVSKNKLAVSSLLEGALQVSVVMAVAMAMLVFDRRLDVINVWLKIGMVGVLAICVFCMLPPVFNRIMSITYKLFKRKTLDQEHLANGKTIASGASLFVVNAILAGLSLFFIAKAVDPTLSSHNLFFVMGAANLAGAASMLAVFAPSGLGVREGIQLVLFALIMPKELALIVVTVTRLWSIIVDFVFFGLSAAVSKLWPDEP